MDNRYLIGKILDSSINSYQGTDRWQEGERTNIKLLSSSVKTKLGKHHDVLNRFDNLIGDIIKEVRENHPQRDDSRYIQSFENKIHNLKELVDGSFNEQISNTTAKTNNAVEKFFSNNKKVRDDFVIAFNNLFDRAIEKDRIEKAELKEKKREGEFHKKADRALPGADLVKDIFEEVEEAKEERKALPGEGIVTDIAKEMEEIRERQFEREWIREINTELPDSDTYDHRELPSIKEEPITENPILEAEMQKATFEERTRRIEKELGISDHSNTDLFARFRGLISTIVGQKCGISKANMFSNTMGQRLKMIQNRLGDTKGKFYEWTHPEYGIHSYLSEKLGKPWKQFVSSFQKNYKEWEKSGSQFWEKDRMNFIQGNKPNLLGRSMSSMKEYPGGFETFLKDVAKALVEIGEIPEE